MRLAAFGVSLLFACACFAGDSTSKDPNLTSSKMFYEQIKSNVLKSADKLPEDDYGFKPVDTVRSFGQLLAHIADGQYIFCGTAKDGRPQMKGIEKTATTKAAIVSALHEAFAYCDATYAGLTDATASAEVPFFGKQFTKLSILDLNIAHSFEHYGNLVTYMRIKGVVPPSSEPRK